MSQSPPMRLTVRRGSVSAPDPLGKHTSLNHDPDRSSSSKLTIVRVVSPLSSPASPSFAIAPINLSEPSSSPIHHRRSLRRHGSTSGSTGADNRLSFAFSSFSPVSPMQPPSCSFSSSNVQNPSYRAGSPSSSPRLRPSSPQFIRRLSSSGASAFSKPNLTPDQLVDLARQSTSPRYVQHTMSGAASTPLSVAPASPGSLNTPTGLASSLATFTPLPPDVYLPFIDRPAEVTILLSTPPTTKLFSLLAQIFPTQASDDSQNPFTADPSRWTFATLRRWLTNVDRSAVNDVTWVKNARKCVLAHSELIWERLKGALGVPPELELEDEEIEISDEVFDNADVEATLPDPRAEHSSNAIDVSHNSWVPAPHASPLEEALIIEPIIATISSNTSATTSGTSNLPPSSLPTTLSQSAVAQADQGLQDIVEDREEEEASDVNSDSGDCAQAQQEPEPQIHGLRVLTSPAPSSPAVTAHISSYPPSPVVGMNASGRNSVELRSSDFYLPPLTRRLSRTSSHGSVASLGRPVSGLYTYRDIGYNSGSSELGDSESERAYDPVGDRAPGNPLFPSNFARLALGPTLRANNPSLRSPRVTPPYPRSARWVPGGRPPSWVEGWDTVKQEYAVTTASGSSVGGGE
ncbi:hypothetical protein BS17DRAFT_790988 [Gyrodon lividus]|nr:hypothetical protein BS17DRAFT_790988 [Gyrodon lividus]